MIVSFASAAFVVVKTVDAAIHTSIGFYHNYADYSTVGNLMYLYEIILIMAFLFWSFLTTILAILSGSNLWSLTDARLAEAAADSLGVETPITMVKGIKNLVLCMVVALGVAITGYALGENAVELISYFDHYSDKTNNEADQKTDSSSVDAAGTAATQDLVVSHLITALVSYSVLTAISLGGFIFTTSFIGFDDGFDCDLQEGTITQATYAGAFPILAAQTDRASCLETIQQIFDIEDINGDGYITRCEDATLQHAFGSSREYALKFSSAFDRASFNKICNENFPF
jgi:hypothetical protein